MTSTPPGRAAAAYRQSAQHGLDGRAAMALAMQTLRTGLTQAADAYRQQQLDRMCAFNARSLRIIAALHHQLLEGGALGDPAAHTEARYHQRVYAALLRRLPNILLHPDPDAEYAALQQILQPLTQAWQAWPEIVRAMPPTSARV